MKAGIREKHDGALSSTLDLRVWLRLLTCTTIIEKRIRARFARQFDTTLPRFDILATLERHPDGVPMGELSRALLVTNGNITATVKQLVKEKLVSISPAAEDRRSTIVSLTDFGLDRLTEIASAHHGWINVMLSGLTVEDKTQLFSILAKLKKSIAADLHD